MRHPKIFLMIILLTLIMQPTVFAQTFHGQFSTLEEYGLLESRDTQDFERLLDELKMYSTKENIFVDLIDTLFNYSQEHDLNWQKKDLNQIAWVIKNLDWELHKKGKHEFSYDITGGFELEVFHSHGLNFYKDPFQHDIDGDGNIDIYDEDEYLRQYIDIQLGYSNSRMDVGLEVKPILNYYGTGYFQEEEQYQKSFDLEYPNINNLSFAFYGPYFSSVIGEEQILGIRDYLYYDDPEDHTDYNLSGITFQAPLGVVFGVGQETVKNLVEPEKTHDTRWILLGTEGLGLLPFGFYLAEQEFQSPNFHKIGRNVIFALTTDFSYQNVSVIGDLGVNDTGDGYYGQVTGETTVNNLNIIGKVEKSNHFTPIQPINGFTNTEHSRKFKDGNYWTFPARTETGFEFKSSYPLIAGLDWYGESKHFLKDKYLQTGFNVQISSSLTMDLSGKYDYQLKDIYSVKLDSTYDHPNIDLFLSKIFGDNEEARVKAEPIWENDQVTVKGLIDYSWLTVDEKMNSIKGFDIIYHPINDFTFTAKYRAENMQYNVDTLGLNFRRIGSLKYKINEWAIAEVIFENIDFRHKTDQYMVEYTKGNLQFEF